jgi:hypothetical protein
MLFKYQPVLLWYDYFEVCYLKYYTLPRPRVSQDSSRIIFKFQNGLLEQKLYADEVSINFI